MAEPRRGLDDAFLRAVERLRVPVMGTEEAGPWLYHTLRMARPSRVLEAGMGYTTPFIAKALKDNRLDAAAERADLERKSAGYGAARPLDKQWLEESPVIASPLFHQTPHQPIFLAVDSLETDFSSAPRVLPVLEQLGLLEQVTIVNERIERAHAVLDESYLPLDFIWCDVWETLFFFENFWPLLKPGGLLVIHYMLGFDEGEEVLDYIRSVQELHPDELELLSFFEPHKLIQNSLTLLRKRAAAPRWDYPALTAGLDDQEGPEGRGD